MRPFKFSHTINHLSFGRDQKHDYLSKLFGEGKHTDFAPYDGIEIKQKGV
jgi:hypothetical protein